MHEVPITNPFQLKKPVISYWISSFRALTKKARTWWAWWAWWPSIPTGGSIPLRLKAKGPQRFGCCIVGVFEAAMASRKIRHGSMGGWRFCVAKVRCSLRMAGKRDK